jgi:hypothetical protein
MSFDGRNPTSRVSNHGFTGQNVSANQTARSDDRSFANRDTRQNNASPAYFRTSIDAGVQQAGTGQHVIQGYDSWADEYVVFDKYASSNMTRCLNGNPIPNPTIADVAVRADRAIFSYASAAVNERKGSDAGAPAYFDVLLNFRLIRVVYRHARKT